MRVLTFCDLWLWLARAGLLDAAGGAQFRRVLREWAEAGRPAWGWREIVAHANAGADGRPLQGADWERLKAVYLREPQ